jgi:hypothetical protein
LTPTRSASVHELTGSTGRASDLPSTLDGIVGGPFCFDRDNKLDERHPERTPDPPNGVEGWGAAPKLDLREGTPGPGDPRLSATQGSRG